jgi:hypothetical protein
VTAPIPEEQVEPMRPTVGTPPGEHDGELPDGTEPDPAEESEQEHNAGTTEDEPSQ